MIVQKEHIKDHWDKVHVQNVLLENIIQTLDQPLQLIVKHVLLEHIHMKELKSVQIVQLEWHLDQLEHHHLQYAKNVMLVNILKVELQNVYHVHLEHIMINKEDQLVQNVQLEHIVQIQEEQVMLYVNHVDRKNIR